MKYLFRIRQSGKRKYIDQNGDIAISKAFENGGDFFEGLAPVCVGGKWGYMAEDGEIAIEPRFDNCDEFSDGMGLITVGGFLAFVDGGKVGYVDRSGNAVIEPQFADGIKFSGGIAAVRHERSGYCSYINKSGETVINRAALNSEECHDNRIPFEADDKYGFCDSHGQIIIEPRFISAYGFREGLAAVSMKKTGSEGYGFINPLGELVIPHLFKGAMIYFAEDLAAIWEERGYGFIDRAGKIVIPPKFYHAGNFSCGRASIWPDRNWGHGFIDCNGEVVIEPRFKWAKDFENGLALVSLDGKEGYIDTSGKFVWGPVDEEQW